MVFQYQVRVTSTVTDMTILLLVHVGTMVAAQMQEKLMFITVLQPVLLQLLIGRIRVGCMVITSVIRFQVPAM
jgi:hypothetical protein